MADCRPEQIRTALPSNAWLSRAATLGCGRGPLRAPAHHLQRMPGRLPARLRRRAALPLLPQAWFLLPCLRTLTWLCLPCPQAMFDDPLEDPLLPLLPGAACESLQEPPGLP